MSNNGYVAAYGHAPLIPASASIDEGLLSSNALSIPAIDQEEITLVITSKKRPKINIAKSVVERMCGGLCIQPMGVQARFEIEFLTLSL